ncbi:MAG: hypothetical protein V1794_12355 [Candidatus Glassbacteria bacterium]
MTARSKKIRGLSAGVLLAALAAVGCGRSGQRADEALTADFRYAPCWWQSSICLPDDRQKTLVGDDGSLLYDYTRNARVSFGPYADFTIRIQAGIQSRTEWAGQQLYSARVPLVRTFRRAGALEITEEAFALAPPLAWAGPDSFPLGADTHGQPIYGPPRNDLLVIGYRNAGTEPVTFTPHLAVESLHWAERSGAGRFRVGEATEIVTAAPVMTFRNWNNRAVIELEPVRLAPGDTALRCFAVARGRTLPQVDSLIADPFSLRSQAVSYWEGLDLPYGRITVPDSTVQAVLESSIRNIYQAREIRNGLPAFQVGPSVYRGLWVVDGSFLLEAVTFLGREAEARSGIAYLLGFQRPDGSFMLMDGHWKETGIVLWAVTRHARLTGDRQWLEGVWPVVERGFAAIAAMRRQASTDPAAPNYGLIPAGFSDGGLSGSYPEYTNIYWSLAGMKAAAEAARWLGRQEQAGSWQAEYDDFLAGFREAAERDVRTDSHGNRYVPIQMVENDKIPPQKAQWAFLHAVFPGKVFDAEDPILRGNLKMLAAVEREGLVLDTGWLKDGLWNYFASFYAHALLWTGDGRKAARTLYAFANHASPTLVWREEQMPVGEGEAMVGDMPHNWASAEFVRLVRHLLVIERGGELHLFEGLSAEWAGPGLVTRLDGVVTEFGKVSFELTVAQDGRAAELTFEPPERTPPDKVILHLDGWSGREGVQELAPTGRQTVRIELAR